MQRASSRFLPLVFGFLLCHSSSPAQIISFDGNVTFSEQPGNTIEGNVLSGNSFAELSVENNTEVFFLNGTVNANVALSGPSPLGIEFATFGASVTTNGTSPGPGINAGTLNLTIDSGSTLSWTNAPAASAPSRTILVAAYSQGANGFGDSSKNPDSDVYNGGNGAVVSLTHSGSLTISGSGVALFGETIPTVNGLYAGSVGGDGASDHSHDTIWVGNGGDGLDTTVTTNPGSSIQVSNVGTDSIGIGINAQSTGGLPGTETANLALFYGSSGNGGQVTVNHNGTLENSSPHGIGLLAVSTGGAGGLIEQDGASADKQYAVSGNGGTVNVTVGGSISMTGTSGIGVYAVSAAGPSVNNTNPESSRISGGNVSVTVNPGATIQAGGSDSSFSIGVLAMSAGTTNAFNPFSATALSTTGSGSAGAVSVVHNGSITTQGKMAVGIAALGIGGEGVATSLTGEGINFLGLNGQGTSSGGSAITIQTSEGASITTLGPSAHGIVGISAGGGGLLNNGIDTVITGKAFSGGSIVGSAQSNTGANGQSVTLTLDTTSITTGDGLGGGNASIAVVAQSIGGGGGTAGGNSAALFVGDAGGSGGNGGAVTLTMSELDFLTRDKGSHGILAQSIGGGGGNGANAQGIFVATGGQGGSGGTGGEVNLTLDSGSITTLSNFSAGIIAHSIGGGGGHGGYADTAGLFISAAIGGAGGGGGAAGVVDVTNTSATLTTAGNHSPGITAQSIGGGGGYGGAANSYSVGVAFDVSIALGGSGGGGGAAGDVTITNSGNITTGVPPALGAVGPNPKGADSTPLLAQAIGGGGGYGGAATADSLTFPSEEIPVSASFSVAHGGTGGAGGNGGTISLTNTGNLTTYGDGSHAILGQSIGGGGGNGGDSTANAYMIEGAPPSLKVALALGASGGVGGSGQAVTITHGAIGSPATISTSGQFAAGIVAHSIGGGGGNGGAGNSSDSSPNLGADTGTSIDLTFALGGQGAGAGDGGPVSVTQNAGSSISTAGSGSAGIIAQSIGGGGGTGGGGSAAASGDTFEGNLSVGGQGGTASDGGTVTVLNNGLITTQAGDSHGIMAHSIGGGGGAAGTSDAAATIGSAGQVEDALNQPSNSYSVNLAVGHSGGGGGNADDVTITNTAGSILSGVWNPGISTQGTRSFGILAQSIAGGGGTGGAATSSSNSVIGGPRNGKSGTYSVDLAIGSKGGTSGTPGGVTISNSGVITTAGYASHGVIGQSIGGGGGVGGEGTVDSSVTIGLGADIQGESSNNNGSGGTVQVTNTGGIMTTGNDAVAILAQSIGGGGGLASTGTPTFKTSTPEAAPGANLTLGGNAGGSGSSRGGQVTISHSGSILTQGDWSHGILAQSVGGGGGKASSGFSDATTPDISATVGAFDGLGDGGNVSLTLNNGLISTGEFSSSGAASGYSAFGVFLQSVGGGGGVAHDGSLNGTNGQASASSIPGIQTGYEGNGNGGTINLAGTGKVSTLGEAAHAIVLQSVGGSGGLGAQGNSQFDPVGVQTSDPVRISAGGISSTGNGGDVTSTATLQIQTVGDNAFGFLAQSVGGGGGISVAQNASATDAYLGNGNRNIINNAGDLNLTFNSGTTLATSGENAHAIFAQSIGGGGGIANYANSGSRYTTTPPQTYGAKGNGGAVNLEMDGVISTSGNNAYGILAQSIGAGGGQLALGDSLFLGTTGATGSGTGGAVQITQSGRLFTSGMNSVGIFAQSVGASGGNAIEITLNGTLIGGSGNAGYGVWVDSGNNSNLLTIAEGASLSAFSGNAIYYTGETGLDVTNNGTLAGNITLGDGVLTNNGTLRVGEETPQPTAQKIRARGEEFNVSTLRGDLVQTKRGEILVRTDFNSGKGDLLKVQGDATLAGTIRTEAASVLPLVQIKVLEVSGAIRGTVNGSFTAADSILFDYGLARSGKSFRLQAVGADFAPTNISLGRAQKSVAEHLDAIWNEGGNAEFGKLFATLDKTATASPGTYANQLGQLSPGGVLGFGSRRIADLLAFANTEPTDFAQTSRIWGSTAGRSARQSAHDGLSEFTLNSSVTQVGGQAELSDGWFVGGSIAYEYNWLNTEDNTASGDGQGGLGAITVRHERDNWLFTGVAFGSFGFYNTSRSINIPGFQAQVSGAPDLQTAGFLLRAAYTQGDERLYLRPSLTLSTIYVHAGSYSEDGGGALGLEVDSADQTTFIATPGVEVGGKYDLPEGRILRPFLSGSVSFLTNDEWKQKARLTGAPAGAGNFTTVIPMDDLVGRLNAGVEMEWNERLSFSVQYNGEYSENIMSNGGSLSAEWRF